MKLIEAILLHHNLETEKIRIKMRGGLRIKFKNLVGEIHCQDLDLTIDFKRRHQSVISDQNWVDDRYILYLKNNHSEIPSHLWFEEKK